jgi:hypothetical protein
MAANLDDIYRYLKTTEWFKGSHDVLLPRSLVELMISRLGTIDGDVLVWHNVDVAATLVLGGYVDPARVTLFLDHPNKIKWANKLGIKHATDLNRIGSHQYIIGTPPYNKKHNAKRWKDWHQYLEISLSKGQIISLVLPISLLSPGKAWDMVRDRLTLVDKGLSQHDRKFGTSLHLMAGPSASTSASIVSGEDEIKIDPSQHDFIPKVTTHHMFDALAKMKQRSRRAWRRGEIHTNEKHLFTKDGKHEVYHTNAQILRTDCVKPNLEKIRVSVSLSGYPIFKVIKDAYASQAQVWTEFPDVESAQAFADECNSADIQEVLKACKWSGWNSKQVISYL